MSFFYPAGFRFANPKGHVFIAIPTYGDLKAGVVHSLFANIATLKAKNINADLGILAGNCHVDDARNDLCRMFLQSEASHMMFVDGDVQFSASAIAQLLEYDRDIVCGIYPKKDDQETYPYLPLGKETEGGTGNISFDKDGLVEIKGAPGGFMCIRREVIQKLYDKDKNKGLWWTGRPDEKIRVAEIFHRSLVRGRSRRSGDYEFCEKARQAGYKIWAAPNLRFGHIGDKIWTGCIQDYWMRQSGMMIEQAKKSLDAMRAGTADIEDFRWINKAYDNGLYAADHVLLSLLFDLSKECKTVLETGSGASTAIFSAAGCEVTALEAEASWGAKTDRFLRDLGLKGGITYAPLINHSKVGSWYDAKDGEYDLVFIDGPKRDEVGMRARICDLMPQALKSAKVVVVDDTDDGDGMGTLERLNKEFGFVFDIHNGPRRQFAVGTRE